MSTTPTPSTPRPVIVAVWVGVAALAVRLVTALTTTATLDELLDSPLEGGCRGPLDLPDGFPPLHRLAFACTGLSHIELNVTRTIVSLITAAAIGVLAYVVCEAWGRSAAIVTGGLLACSPAALDAGFLARPYGFEFAGACLLVAGFLRIVVLHRGRGLWLAGAIVCMTSTYPVWLLTGLTALAILWAGRTEIRTDRRGWLVHTAVVAAVGIAVVALASNDFGYQESLSTVTVQTSPKEAAVTTLTVVTGPALPTDLADLGNDTPTGQLVVLAAMLALAAAAFVALGWALRREGIGPLTLALAVPIVLGIAFTGAWLAEIDIRPRHYYHLAVPLAALVGLGAARWRTTTWIRATVGALVALVALSAGLRVIGRGAPPEDMRDAAASLDEIVGPEDEVYVVAGFMIIPLEHYLDGDALDVRRGVASADDLDGFARWLASPAGDGECELWIVASKLEVPDPDETLPPMMEPAVADGRGWSLHRAGGCRTTTWEPPVPPETLGAPSDAPQDAPEDATRG